MTKLAQYGGFDDSLEQSIRDSLLTEFSEETLDFAACQRADGSVYPIASGAQCRRGTPISIKPGEKHRDIMRKGQQAGLKVRSILEENDRLRQEKGLKRVQGEEAIRSLARRLNERMGHGQKPVDIKGVKSVEEAAKAVRKPEKKQEDKKPSQQINKKFLQERTTQKLQAYLNDRKLYPYQRKAIEAELARRAQAGKGAEPQRPAQPDLRARVKARKAAIDDVNKQIEQVRKRRQEPAYQKPENKAFLDSVEKGLIRRRMDIIAGIAPSRAGKRDEGTRTLMSKAIKPGSAGKEARLRIGQKIREKAGLPYGLDKDLGVMVNKKLLAQDTDILQRILRERSLNPRQRAKIEEEVAGRGESPASAQRAQKLRGPAAGARNAGWNITQVAKDYDPVAVYNNPSNQLLARGSFGAAYRTDGPPPGIIKQGKIGEHEVEVWQKLQRTGRVPEIHGAAVSRRMKEVGPAYGGHVREASGYLGLGVAKGRPVASIVADGNDKRDILNEYIRARRDIHVAGVAHNDMHAANVFYDRATGKMQLIDFGLAQPSYKAALMEAFTTNQGDWQSERFISKYMPRGDEPAAYNRFRRNQRAVMRRLEEDGIDTERLMGMGIRNKSEHIDRVLEGMSETAAQSYIKALYEGV